MATALARRGTSNTNERGSSTARRRRREWLVETYRADADLLDLDTPLPVETDPGFGQPACRCYRCGALLTVDTVTVDRIIPGCQGGTYKRNNIRPACGYCNSSTGAKLARRTNRKEAA